MRAVVGCLLFFAVGVFECRSQAGIQTPANSSDLSFLVTEEAKRGIYLFYTQSFLDRENQRVHYRGSLYGAIQKFELNGCELAIEAMIVDKFAGTVGNRPTGALQDTYGYSASLMLTREIAAGLMVIEARPAQLGHSFHSLCEGDSSCSFPWLQFQTKQRIIGETSIVNDSQNFHGQVDHFVVPISSSDSGKRIVEELRKIADSRCN
jgi:hypothetical protein